MKNNWSHNLQLLDVRWKLFVFFQRDFGYSYMSRPTTVLEKPVSEVLQGTHSWRLLPWQLRTGEIMFTQRYSFLYFVKLNKIRILIPFPIDSTTNGTCLAPNQSENSNLVWFKKIYKLTFFCVLPYAGSNNEDLVKVAFFTCN